MVRNNVALRVTIPPGLAARKRVQRLRVRAVGHARRDDGKLGDLYLHVASAVQLVV